MQTLALPVIGQMETKDATDIAKAIDLAAAVAKNNMRHGLYYCLMVWKRWARLKSYCLNIVKDVSSLTLFYLERPGTADASISIFDTPRTAYEGEKQLLQVEVESSTRTTGELLIYQNDKEIIQRTGDT